MLLRVARNVINAFNRRPASELELPWFAALVVLSMITPNLNLGGRICDFIRNHPSLRDTGIGTIELACGARAAEDYEDHMEYCRVTRHQEIAGPPQKRKNGQCAGVQYSIGQIFKHRFFGYAYRAKWESDSPRYTGIIHGYDLSM